MSSNRALHFIQRNFNRRSLQRRLLHFALKGNDVECVCCGSKYITFLPAGIQKRANARCPNCESLERHRLLWMYFEKMQPELFSKPLKLLHVAPEKLYYQKFSSFQNIQYYPIDLHPNDYDYGKKTIAMDVTKLSFENNFFDAIICNHVLEHVPEDKKAMSEMFRTLKPGGWATINVPVSITMDQTFEDPFINDPQKQLELFGQPDHVRVYGNDYFDRLKAAGFDVEVIDFAASFSHNERFRYGIKNEPVILCRKHSF